MGNRAAFASHIGRILFNQKNSEFNLIEMSSLQQAKIEEVAPSPYGYAVFVSAGGKVFVIYVERSRGAALLAAFRGEKSERPLTHEFIVQILDGFGANLLSTTIYHEDSGTFFTRMTLSMRNEVASKILEIDGRPSDTLALAMRTSTPVYVSKDVLDKVADMSEALRKIRGAQ